MNMYRTARTTCVVLTLLVAACSSNSNVEPETEQSSGLSGIDATNQRTQELAEEARRRAAEAEDRIRRAALDTTVFYFDFDISEFRQSDRDMLSLHARELAGNPSKSIRLEGHADERGTREYNLALGERRSESIMNFFIVNGVSRNQIQTVSYGEERPAQMGTDENALQSNRRVEIVGE